MPLDADLVFDVRCLPNPHYEPQLAPLTGRDAPVVAFLEALPEVERMYGDIYHFVASWLPDYARDNRNYLTVAIGCTGGRHRSVYLVERLAQHVRRALPGAGPPSRARLTRRRAHRRVTHRPMTAPRTDHARLHRRVRACRSACGCSNACVAARCRVYLLYSPAAQVVAKQECDLTLPTQPREAARLFSERYGARRWPARRVRARGLDGAGRVGLESGATRWPSARAAWARSARSPTASPTT